MEDQVTGRSSGCEEHQLLLSRRGFLAGAVGLYTSAMIPGEAFANSTSADPRLLIVILRGGVDGLSVLVPFGDQNYEALRGDLAVNRERLLRITPFFGIHPALTNLHDIYRSGRAAFLPSVGLPVRTRSHFQCQANLENGLPERGSSTTGWLNRLLQSTQGGNVTAGGGPLTVGPVPRILAGQAPVLSWSPSWFAEPASAVQSALERVYRSRDAELNLAFTRGRTVHRTATRASESLSRSQDPLVLGFGAAARLLRANSGPRVAVLSVSGWDTHSSQGTLEGQTMNRLSLLDRCIGVFRQELGAAAWGQTVVMCVSEFGRTARINGTQGTDHGIGMPVILFGGAVSGGIHGDWPGLSASDLVDGRDLRPTADLRSVFKGVLRDHMGVSQRILNETAFPTSAQTAPVFPGLVRTASSTRATSSTASTAGSSLRSSALPRDAARDLLSYRTLNLGS